jgi:class 3 adenylate cyclase
MESATPSVFDYVFDPDFQRQVENWRDWAGFFVQHARGLTDRDGLERLIELRSERQLDVIKTLLAESGSFPYGQATSHGMQQVLADGSVVNFSIITTDFDEGRLVVFNALEGTGPDKYKAGQAQIEQGLKIIRQQSQPLKIPLHVLALRLNDAKVLQAELLADDYNLLLNRVWQTCMETIERFGGIIGHYSSNELFASFSPVFTSEESPSQTLSCALELKDQMVEIGREWKIRKGWLHEITLNMGIHGGEDHVAAIQSFLGEHLLSYGDTLEIASQLARIAQNGQIIASKSFINLLPQRELRHVRFGVFRQELQRQIYIANCFSRLKDLTRGAGSSLSEIYEIGDLPVTQVFDRNTIEHEYPKP